MHALISALAVASGIGLTFVLAFEPWEPRKCETVAKVLAGIFGVSSMLAIGFAL